MKRLTITIVGILLIQAVYSQNIDKLLQTIEENNTTLKALRASIDAQKIQNATIKNLSNPEVGFNYLWGSPSGIGNRQDISVSQSFDIPTITGLKGKVVNEKNALIEWEYMTERMNVLLEAKKFYIEMIYFNALRDEMLLRLKYAQTTHDVFKERLNLGDANILEYNKSRLNLSIIQGEISRIEVERVSLSKQIQRLNGGIAISVEESELTELGLPENFDEWYSIAEQSNPVLAYAKQSIELNKRNVSLNKVQNLPELSVGYLNENTLGQQYQGITTGITIPIWQNRNKVKYAKAQVFASQEKETDSKQQFYSQLRMQYNRAMGLLGIAKQYRKTLETANNVKLLNKALELGQISILEYILEVRLYYELMNLTLEAERDYRLAFAELTAVDL